VPQGGVGLNVPQSVCADMIDWTCHKIAVFDLSNSKSVLVTTPTHSVYVYIDKAGLSFVSVPPFFVLVKYIIPDRYAKERLFYYIDKSGGNDRGIEIAFVHFFPAV